MKRINVLFSLLFMGFCLNAQDFEKTKDLKKEEGFFNYFYDSSRDKILLQVSDLEKDFLYVYSLSSGIGSNDIGLDRGQLGNEQLVYFKKAGDKLLLVQPNLKFRAITENKLEKRSVTEAFAKSVLFGFKIVEEKGGKYLIDITDFLMQDMHGVAERLKSSGQGSYKIDTTRSAMALERTSAFPGNVEFDVVLTFTGKPEGDYIKSVTPDPRSLSVNQHHSFIKLPDDGYSKREFDPRSGSYPFEYYDYASPVEEPLVKRYIRRHRLEKKNPSATVSEAVEPIVYYLDNGTPEPVRSALLEGGKWWNQAFEAIGYKDAFQLKILPDDADPLDVRYNVIQWVHRSTRGWSYGNSITDPRTGEILKGHVSLGSLRIRQDFLIAQALSEKPFAERDDNHERMLQLALARIRQLSAHEIGHTLGFAHNFAASTNGRASVMDYPHPLVGLQNGKIDFSKAYDSGIGEWDKVTVAYSYSDFPEQTKEGEALKALLADAYDKGLRYISDQDARPTGGAHASGHLWDNGGDATDELERMLDVRQTAIAQFGEDNIRSQEAYSVLEDVFVPLYFYHRYQTEAAVKLIGGLNYNYAVKGGGEVVVEPVDPRDQKNALSGILRTLHAEILAIPRDKLDLFPPRAIGFNRDRESFQGRTGVAFDPLAAAETASDMTLSLLLHPERASRLVLQKSMDPKQTGLQETIEVLLQATIENTVADPYLQQIQNTVNYRVLFHLMNLAAGNDAHPQVNAIAHKTLRDLRQRFTSSSAGVHQIEMARRITEFYEHPDRFKVVPAPKIPDGSPIGMDCMDYQTRL